MDSMADPLNSEDEHCPLPRVLPLVDEAGQVPDWLLEKFSTYVRSGLAPNAVMVGIEAVWVGGQDREPPARCYVRTVQVRRGRGNAEVWVGRAAP
jgi:hypothetical protein